MIAGIETFLQGMGLDLTDQHLIRTPQRVAHMWRDTLGEGYSYNEESITEILKVTFKQDYDELVIVKDIPFNSTCSHHLLPFSGTAKIGYLPDKKIVGLSKLPRILDVFAKRLQVQERLTEEVAETLHRFLKPKGVGVILTAEHLCATCRGVQKPGTKMVTSCLLGTLRTDSKMRSEFLTL